jgi:phosphoribosylformylglycinamidine synthase
MTWRGKPSSTSPAPSSTPTASLLAPAPPGDVAVAWQEVLGELRHASQKGLIEMFDSTIGGAPSSTPSAANTAPPPPRRWPRSPTETGTLRHRHPHELRLRPAWSAAWSPFHGAQVAVLDSVARVIAAGGERARVRLTLQEYFEKLRDEPTRWGKPFAALLGALTAQEAFGTAAIGGKDSMSGSFGELDVPPTLVSFAIAPVAAARVLSPELKEAGHRLVHLAVPRDVAGVPTLDGAVAVFDTVERAIGRGEVVAARALGSGGLAVALAEMAFGNGLGVRLEEDPATLAALTRPGYGDFVLEVVGEPTFGRVIGETTSEPVLRYGAATLPLALAQAAWEAPLEDVYPTRVPLAAEGTLEVRFEPTAPARAKARHARPRVVLPTFPGTNCEYDSARAFREAGAEVETVLFRNLRPSDVAESIERLARAIESAQILFLPGGFSAGDEPAGSGKFIAAAFRHPRLTDATGRLLHERDGLVLGICNGFQALIKLGLLPFGEIRPLRPDDPTLTYNLIGRHVSCYARTKVVSRRSPWLAHCELGAEHLIPMSHGEGRFVANDAVIRQLVSNDQIATQYVDERGKPTLAMPHNPNGSAQAIEGITSPCGRIFGKMGHSERAGPDIGRNIPGPKHQPLFTAGVAYFA